MQRTCTCAHKISGFRDLKNPRHATQNTRIKRCRTAVLFYIVSYEIRTIRPSSTRQIVSVVIPGAISCRRVWLQVGCRASAPKTYWIPLIKVPFKWCPHLTSRAVKFTGESKNLLQFPQAFNGRAQSVHMDLLYLGFPTTHWAATQWQIWQFLCQTQSSILQPSCDPWASRF